MGESVKCIGIFGTLGSKFCLAGEGRELGGGFLMVLRVSSFWCVVLFVMVCGGLSWGQVESGRGAATLRSAFRADANHDGKLSLEEIRAYFPGFDGERFSRLDRNRDGFLRRNELAGVGRGEDREVLRAAVDQLLGLDVGKDGEVTFAEVSMSKPGYPREVFNRLDVNGDGVLSQLDVTQIQLVSHETPLMRSRVQKLLRSNLTRADANRDGEVTYEEAVAQFPNLQRASFRRMDLNGDGVLSRKDRGGRR